MTAALPWTDIAQELTLLQGLFLSAQQAAIDSVGADQADPFLERLQALGQALVQLQTKLTGHPAQDMPAAVQLQLDELRTSMDTLLALNHRLSAQAQRALAVLLPPDAVQAYSRLGGRGMGTVSSGSGYLKA
jgi:hypothetical protein